MGSVGFDVSRVVAQYLTDMHIVHTVDPAKSASNLKKHRVSFADVEGVFYDPLAIHLVDHDSEDEERFVAVGTDSAGQVLVVVYTFRGEEIRLISARRATPHEVTEYEG